MASNPTEEIFRCEWCPYDAAQKVSAKWKIVRDGNTLTWACNDHLVKTLNYGGREFVVTREDKS